MSRIIAAEIIADPPIVPGLAVPSGTARMSVTYEDGSVESLFGWYVDELTFTADEMVGLSRDEALRLNYDRDLAWLRS